MVQHPPSQRPDPSERIERSPLEMRVLSRYFVWWRAILVALVVAGVSALGAQLLLTADSVRYAFGAVAVLCLGILIFLRPIVGFWSYYFMAFGRPHDVVWGLTGLRISLGLAVFALVAVVAHLILHRRPFFGRHPLSLSMLGICAVVAASGLAAGGDYDRMIELVKMLLFATLFSWWIDRRSWVRQGLWLVAISCGFLTFWALHQRFFEGVYMLVGPGTGRATFKDRNFFSMVLLIAIPFYWYFAQATRRLVLRILLYALIPLTVFCVFLTASRGGLLGVAGIAGAIGWQSRHRWPAVIGGLVLVAGFYVVAAPPTLKNRADTIVNYEGESSAEGRINSWKAGTNMMLHNPFLGVGPGNYVKNYSRYHDSAPRQAHNSLVQMGGEYGLLGLILFVLFQWQLSRSLLRSRDLALSREDEEAARFARILWASLVGYWVTAFFLSAEGLEFIYYYAALAVGLEVVLRREGARQEEAA